MTPPARTPQARRLFLLSTLSALALAGCSARSPGSWVVPGSERPPTRNEVALLAPLNGEDAGFGLALANSARLAIADMNNRSIQLTIYNTAEGGAAAAADRAIANGARLILGPLLSDQVRAVAPIARQARVPVLAFSNDETAAGGGTYILGFVPGQAVDRVVRHSRTAGAVNFGALVPDNVYGQRAAQGLLLSAQRSGGQVVGSAAYASAEQGRAAARNLAGRLGLHAVLLVEGGRNGAALARQFKPSVRILGPDLWANDRTLGSHPRLRGAWYAAPSDARFGQFVTRYKARYGSTPPRLASISYDAMLLVIRESREWRPGRRFPVEKLSDSEGFLGVDGVFRFNRRGIAERGLEVRQVTAGGYSILSPAPTRF